MTMSPPKSKTKLKYKSGQEIVYPLQGVGHIQSIEERPFRDGELLYYIVYIEVSDMTIMVPVDRADELGISINPRGRISCLPCCLIYTRVISLSCWGSTWASVPCIL